MKVPSLSQIILLQGINVSAFIPSVTLFRNNAMINVKYNFQTQDLGGNLKKSTALCVGIKGTNLNEHNQKRTFDEMKSLELRLERLEQVAPDTLMAFYEPHLRSFSVRPGSLQRLSITSTLFSLLAIISSSDASLYETIVNLDMRQPSEENKLVDGRISARNVIEAVFDGDWNEEDLFQVPLLLHTILEIDPNREFLKTKLADEVHADKMKKIIESLFDARPMRRLGQTQLLSDYILFLLAQALFTMQKFTTTSEQTKYSDSTDSNNDNIEGIAGLPEKVLPAGAASLLFLSLQRCYETSFNELCRQLAFRSAGDRTNFDVIRLAYSLLTYVTAANSLCGTAGREITPGEGPSPGTTVNPPNNNLITKALSAFFDEQTSDGMWDKGQPIYKSFRKTGRNVGNAFVFTTDTLSSLLNTFPAESFRPHLHNLEKTINWIERHQTTEYIPNYCDPESGQCYGKPLRGWCSPHIAPNSGPQAWSTAQTLTCVTKLRYTVRELMHDDVLAEFGGVQAQERASSTIDPWDRLLDSDLGDPSSTDYSTLKEVLESRVLTPFSSSMSRPSFGAAYSTILFGPPGTAKTTICEALAQRMGWDFLVIDTAVFLADGLSNVAARIQYVFERLRSLDRCIILFDEIEEFCLDRESPGLGMESRMLTTAMLTAINDLRRAKRSIFFVATNRLRAFDTAITRPGRFDIQLFVGTPNLNSRCIQFQQKLATTVVLDEKTKGKALSSYTTFLESVWTQDAMFMNYLEGLQFASTCADIVASGDELTEEAMSLILKNQAAVMTVRGSARDEVIASMNLSRF